jgi:WD40-like Beta Propeller Repeat
MDRESRAVRAALVIGLVSLALFAVPAPSRAAFPGRNGLLVVQPANRRGLLLVRAEGANARQICTVATRCDGARDPVWSPDGSEITFLSLPTPGSELGGLQPNVIYPDGSCLACPVPAPTMNGSFLVRWDPHFGQGFLADGSLALSVDTPYPSEPGEPQPGEPVEQQVGAVNTDGVAFRSFDLPVSSHWDQSAWSPTGQLAAVRLVNRKSEVFVIDPSAGSARQLTHDGAGSPNWSPDGRRLAVVHRGWIELIGLQGGRVRRLARGHAPAWAPDGKQLAFVGGHDRLFVIAARGGRPRAVGRIRADRVDWQPVTAHPPGRCQAPVDSSVLTTTPDATITIDPGQGNQEFGRGFSVLGCMTSDGRERVLEDAPSASLSPSSFNPYTEFGVGPVAVAGVYAALVNESTSIKPGYGDNTGTVAVFDLRTGTGITDRGGEATTDPYGSIDQLVLGPDAVTAVLMSGEICVTSSPCTSIEQIVANDSSGTRVLDSIDAPGYLSGLALSGDTLTWSHDGTPESAQLN